MAEYEPESGNAADCAGDEAESGPAEYTETGDAGAAGASGEVPDDTGSGDGYAESDAETADARENPGIRTYAGETAFAVYSASDNSLTFYAKSSVPPAGDTYNGKTVTNVYTGFDTETYAYNTTPWYSIRASITSVVIDESFKNVKPVSLECWFYEMINAQFNGLENIDTSYVTSLCWTFGGCSKLINVDGLSEWDTSKVITLRYTFYGCSSLTSIDVSNWNTSEVTDMRYMFYGCTKLETIYSDDNNFVTSKVTSGTYMFTNCTSLVGGNGTKYSSSNVTYTMAHCDTADNPGYFTDINYYNVKYAVSIYGIQADTLEDGSTAGLTFGPATGESYVSSYNGHLTEEEYEPGDYGVCLHWMSWQEIIDQSAADPTVFQACLENGCTHSINLNLNDTLLATSYEGQMDDGDGAGMLCNSMNSSYRMWNSSNNNTGGWPASQMRAVLNGKDSLLGSYAT